MTIKPWVSELQQTVGGAPPSASFKRASDFLGPGGGDNGLAALAHGLGRLGGAMFGIGIEERQAQQQMTVLQDAFDASDRLEKAKNALQLKYQGRNAAGAADAFKAEHQKEYNGLLNKWQGILPAQKFLSQHLGTIGARGYSSMLAHERQQSEVWADSLMKGNEAEFLQYSADPGRNPEDIAAAAQNFMGRLGGFYKLKGLDPRSANFQAQKQFHQLMGNRATDQVMSLIESGSPEAGRFIFGLPRSSSLSSDVRSLAEKEAAAQGVDPALVLAVISAESGGDPRAVSRAGAQGLMQLMPGTAGELGVSDPHDPAQNVRGGISYLGQMLKKYGNLPEALAAYNWGPGNMDDWIKGGRKEAIPTETRKYVRAVLTDMKMQGGWKQPGGQGPGGGYSMPLASYTRISSHYSQARKNPVDGVVRPHNGTDIAAPAGTPVTPISGGTVITAARDDVNGNYIVIRHDDGRVASSYSHLQGFAEDLKIGDRVEAGQEIGYVGSTGRSKGAHLHLGIRVNGRRVDPARFLGLQDHAAGEPEDKPVMLAGLAPGVSGGDLDDEVVSDAFGVAPGADAETDLEDDEPIDAEFEILAEDEEDFQDDSALTEADEAWYPNAARGFDLETTLSDPVIMFHQFATPAQKARATRAYYSALARQAKAEEAALKKAGQEAQKDLTDMKYGVEGSQPFTADEVVARRDVLSPSDYERLMREAREGTPPPTHSNPDSVIALARMAVNGDADLQAFADEELKAGRLTVPDHRAALNEGQQFRDPPVKMAMEAIRLKVGYSELNPNPDASNSFLQAKQDFLAWLESPAGKNASTTEKVEMGNRIGDNYRIIRMENSILSVPAPLFQVGSRMAPDIQKTIEATQAARDAGELTEDEYAEQAIRIKRIADILEQQQAEAIAASTRQSGGRK